MVNHSRRNATPVEDARLPLLFAAAPPPRPQGLTPLDYAAVVGYLLFTAGIVWWSSRRQSNTEQFFVGGRRLPWFAVGLSIMATLLSTLTYLGTPGEVIKNGITMLWKYVAYMAVIPFVMLVLVPFFMRLRMTSAYEYLQRRFDFRVQIMGSILFFCLRLGWISMVMYAGSLALSEMTHYNIYAVILTLGLASTVYACFGGLKAVVWTDVLQAIMLFGGAFVIIIYVMYSTDSSLGVWWDAAAARSDPNTKPAPFIDFDPFIRMTVLTVVLDGIFWNICTHGSDQVVLQRYFATPSVGTAMRGFVVTIISQMTMAFLLAVAGLALLYFYVFFQPHADAGYLPEGVKGDKVMPYFYGTQLPLGFAGLILANFLCDAMQTLVSGVNSMSAVVTKDLFGRGAPGEATSDRRQLRFARGLTVIIGLGCTGLGLGAAAFLRADNDRLNIYDMLPKFNMFLGPLGCLFFIGMFIPRATARTAIISVLFALSVSAVWTWWKEICRLVFWICSTISPAGYEGLDFISWYKGVFGTENSLSISLAVPMPCIVGFVTAFVLSRILDGDGDHGGKKYSWSQVMRLPPPAESETTR